MNASRMAAMVLSLLLLAYPLSSGPITRYMLGRDPSEYKQLPPAWYAFYSPMRMLCQVPLFNKVIQAYMWLWIPKETIENYHLNPPWDRD
jgi:hypothetical protein